MNDWECLQRELERSRSEATLAQQRNKDARHEKVWRDAVKWYVEFEDGANPAPESYPLFQKWLDADPLHRYIYALTAEKNDKVIKTAARLRLRAPLLKPN